MAQTKTLRWRQKLDKYRIERCLCSGPFASVYRAYDTIEGVRVALKIPQPHLADRHFLEEFRREVRLAARLDHEHILPVKNASYLDGHFVIALPLGTQTLADRLSRRMAMRTALDFAGQALDAVAYAHSRGVIHCDIKPENFILFPDNRLRLADFGIAKIARRTVAASGSGTIGYVAPEQAMGHPSFQSDVFSLGLLMCRMFSGVLPQWPYEWPCEGYARLRRRVHPELIDILSRAIDPDPRARYADARPLQGAFERVRLRALQFDGRRRRRNAPARAADWQEVRFRQFQRLYGKRLETRHNCRKCEGPVAEAMLACPWCGTGRKVHREPVRQVARCTRCRRGVKREWKYCAWCYGGQMPNVAKRRYPDARYVAHCSNQGCRGPLMAHMRYCPWCRHSVKRRWPVTGCRDRCGSCGHGVVSDFWDVCPWCTKALSRRG